MEKGENDFYAKHASVSIIAKKTEKIATAIYMVTDFVSESEPLRMRLRTLGLALVSGTQKLATRSSEAHYALSGEMETTIEETVTLITLATTIGLISEMNGTILKTELEKTKAEIERSFGAKKILIGTHPGYRNVILKKSFFDVAPSGSILPVYDKGQDSYKGQTGDVKQNQQKEDSRSIQKESFKKKNDIGIKIARRNDVLNVVRKKGKVSIKDVVLILKDTSEKTVQRELLALVREGVLVKEGAKRWSTYRVAS